MSFHKEIKDNELYLYMNGTLIYKRWLDTGQSKVFDVLAYDKYTLSSIRDQNMDHVINFKDFKLSFDRYKDKVDKILTTELNFLWMDAYYDGMLCGMLKFKSQYYRFEIITEYVNGPYPRIFAVIILTEEQIEEEIFWHDLFRKHVGNHNDFNGDEELVQKPYSEHHLFYDKFNNRPEVNYAANSVKGWFIEQVGH